MQTANPHLQRAEVLLQQNRYDLAEKELRQAIAMEPNEALAYSYLAGCLAERKEWLPATQAAQQGVGLDPASGYSHYALARVLSDRHLNKEARASIDEAIRLEPYDPNYWALRAQIDINEKKFKDGL